MSPFDVLKDAKSALEDELRGSDSRQIPVTQVVALLTPANTAECAAGVHDIAPQLMDQHGVRTSQRILHGGFAAQGTLGTSPGVLAPYIDPSAWDASPLHDAQQKITLDNKLDALAERIGANGEVTEKLDLREHLRNLDRKTTSPKATDMPTPESTISTSEVNK